MTTQLPWLQLPAASTSADWPTRVCEVPDLRARVGVPDSWRDQGTSSPPEGERSAVFRGDSPLDWLEIRHRVDVGSEALARWTDGVQGAIGFPVVPPGRLVLDLPELLSWPMPGGVTDEHDRDRLGLDELLGYEGLAAWDGRRLRLYVVLARRGDDAWRLTLGIESALLPGMPDDLVWSNDHVRAAAVFGALSFGH
ncbi:hypothetical protein [Nocardioides sp. W7]|uniref:hypothetical protein n=1 Tax=Nocardioides sp. W7 TaxID=2931390 RepID=UPI001FD4DFAE|nr:hypothetical protein [Nocardioides sp. W7]